MHTIDEVSQHFGGIPALAAKLGCTPQAIYMWRGKIPKTRAYQIEVLSGGVFKVDRLPVRKRRH